MKEERIGTVRRRYHQCITDGITDALQERYQGGFTAKARRCVMNTTAWYGLIDDNGLVELRVEKDGKWLSKHHATLTA